MTNKFAVILPVYNGGTLVKECVDSILAQSYQHFNLIVLDNRSDDGTLEWLNSLKDDRIIIHSSEVKLSIEQNWARIKEIEKNEFITLIGHDDILLPGYLEEMNNLIEKHPQASLYQTHFSFIDAAGNFKSNCKPMTEIQHAHEFLTAQFTLNIDSTGTGYMMRSKDYDQVGGISPAYPNLIYADFQLWVQLTLKSYKATSNKLCFKYRVHDSASRLTNGEQYQVAFEKYAHFISALCKSNEDVKSVVEAYGHKMLMQTLEGLSHRLLKTPMNLRKIKIKELVVKFNEYASDWIPGQQFKPLSKFRIWIAVVLDQNAVGRRIFNVYKGIKHAN